MLDAFVVFFGAWTLYCNVLVFSQASFHLLMLLSPLPVAVSFGLWIWLRRGATSATRQIVPREARVPWPYKLGAAAIVVAGYVWTQQLVLFWVLGTIFLVGCLLDQPRNATPARQREHGLERLDVVLLIVAILLAVTFTAIVHRPDADDAYYMSVPVALLDHPDRPVLQSDTMHGDEGFPLLGPFYRTVSYEVLIGAVAFVSGLDHRIPYYVLFPLVFAALLVIAHWLPLRLICPRIASTGVLFVCLAMMVWGDVHHTYGNFGLVRLFQGKAVLVSICAPAVLYYGLRFSSSGNRFDWVRLGLAQVAMMGLSASGVVIAPLLGGLVLLGSWRPDGRSTRILFLGLLASAVVVLEGVMVLVQVREFGEIVSPLEDTSTAKSLGLVLGHGWRAYLALYGLLGAAALSCATSRHRGIVGYLTAAFVLLLSPWSGDLISRAEETFAWRSLWAIPFPLILALAVAQLARRGPTRLGFRLGALVAVIFALVFTLSPGRWTWIAENKAQVRLAVFRVGEGSPAAERAVQVTPRDGVILAPRKVAMWITGIRGHPRLLGVRQDYLDIVVGKALGADEARRRRELMEFVHGKRETGMFREIADEIVRRRIDTVVTHPDLAARGGQAFFTEIADRGYEREEADNGYLIWKRSLPAG